MKSDVRSEFFCTLAAQIIPMPSCYRGLVEDVTELFVVLRGGHLDWLCDVMLQRASIFLNMFKYLTFCEYIVHTFMMIILLPDI